jgi:putative ABC transport system substrate-binding protein
MRRREVIKLLAAVAAWPTTARAQQAGIPALGFLHGGSPDANAHLVTAFRAGLAELGFVDGRNVKIEFRWANGQIGPLARLADEMVRRNIAAIFAGPSPAALAAKAATKSIPIVFTSGVDPVQMGLVDSINRPGGNLTGISQFTHVLDGKRLELMRELVGKPGLFGLLVNQDSPAATA